MRGESGMKKHLFPDGRQGNENGHRKILCLRGINAHISNPLTALIFPISGDGTYLFINLSVDGYVCEKIKKRW